MPLLCRTRISVSCHLGSRLLVVLERTTGRQDQRTDRQTTAKQKSEAWCLLLCAVVLCGEERANNHGHDHDHDHGGAKQGLGSYFPNENLNSSHACYVSVQPNPLMIDDYCDGSIPAIVLIDSFG